MSKQKPETKSAYRNVTCLEAFKLLGARISKRGVAEADALVRTGEVRHKRYRVRRRASDGETTYRWGLLGGAEVIQLTDDPSDFIVVFLPAELARASSSDTGETK